MAKAFVVVLLVLTLTGVAAAQVRYPQDQQVVEVNASANISTASGNWTAQSGYNWVNGFPNTAAAANGAALRYSNATFNNAGQYVVARFAAFNSLQKVGVGLSDTATSGCWMLLMKGVNATSVASVRLFMTSDTSYQVYTPVTPFTTSDYFGVRVIGSLVVATVNGQPIMWQHNTGCASGKPGVFTTYDAAGTFKVTYFQAGNAFSATTVADNFNYSRIGSWQTLAVNQPSPWYSLTSGLGEDEFGDPLSDYMDIRGGRAYSPSGWAAQVFNDFGSAMYNVFVAPSLNHFAQGSVYNVSSGAGMVCARAQSNNSRTDSSGQGYCFLHGLGGDKIVKLTGPNFTWTVLAQNAGAASANHDVMKLEAGGVNPVTLTAYVNGAQVLTASDSSSPYGAGYPGVGVTRSNVGIYAFSGGATFSVSSQTPSDAVSMVDTLVAIKKSPASASLDDSTQLGDSVAISTVASRTATASEISEVTDTVIAVAFIGRQVSNTVTVGDSIVARIPGKFFVEFIDSLAVGDFPSLVVTPISGAPEPVSTVDNVAVFVSTTGAWQRHDELGVSDSIVAVKSTKSVRRPTVSIMM